MNQKKENQTVGIARHGLGTIDGLWDAISDALPTIVPAACANYLIAAGYEPE